MHEGDGLMQKNNVMDSYFYALNRVVDVIYLEDEDLADVLHFILSLATELTNAKGSIIRVLEQGSFDLKAVSSYGLSQNFLDAGVIDSGKSATEIMEGDTIIINDFENDPRITNLKAAQEEGVSAFIGIPFSVNETTYSILRVYFPSKKVPSHEEMEMLNSLGKLSCIAIEHAVIRSAR